MARGKKAASAAGRRAAEASDAAQLADSRLSTERAAWQAERAELLNKVQTLQGALGREVEQRAKALADGQLAEAHRREAEARRQGHDQAWEVFRIAVRDNEGFAATMEVWTALAAALDTHPGALMPETSTRNTRRTRMSKVRKLDDVRASRLLDRGPSDCTGRGLAHREAFIRRETAAGDAG